MTTIYELAFSPPIIFKDFFIFFNSFSFVSLQSIDSIVNEKCFYVVDLGEIECTTTNEITIKNLVRKICHFMNYKGKIIKKINRVADVKSHNSSNKKMRKLINFKK